MIAKLCMHPTDGGWFVHIVEGTVHVSLPDDEVEWVAEREDRPRGVLLRNVVAANIDDLIPPPTGRPA